MPGSPTVAKIYTVTELAEDHGAKRVLCQLGQVGSLFAKKMDALCFPGPEEPTTGCLVGVQLCVDKVLRLDLLLGREVGDGAGDQTLA